MGTEPSTLADAVRRIRDQVAASRAMGDDGAVRGLVLALAAISGKDFEDEWAAAVPV